MSLHYQLTAKLQAKPISKLESRQPVERVQVDNGWIRLSQWFGDRIKLILSSLNALYFNEVEEIRLRIGQPLLIRTSSQEIFLTSNGKPCSLENAFKVEREDIIQTLERMTQSSIYAAEEELKQGFLTLPGGHRVGITGEAVMQQGKIQTLKHISAINVRIARAVRGCTDRILPLITEVSGDLRHTLLISPPRAGKTTMLRELIRSFSEGIPELGIVGQTVGVIDERGELAGSWQGNPIYNLGPRTDILDGCPKAVGLGILIRAMSPTIIAMDELGHPDDVEAVRDALRTGVKIISTAHASSLEEAKQRTSLKALFEDRVFERLIVLSRRKGAGTIEGIYDLLTGKEILPKTGSETRC